MKIFLLRHGQTTGDVDGRYGGLYEDHLTKLGQEQAEELAERLSDKDIEKVFVSPRIRAIETSLILAKKVPAKITAVNEFSERNNYGVLTGLTKKEAKEKFPDEVEELEANAPYHHVKASEDYYMWVEKLLAKFNEIIENEFLLETESIAIVTHSGPIKAIFREIIGFEVEGIKDCALFELNFDGDGYEIIYAKDAKRIWAEN